MGVAEAGLFGAGGPVAGVDDGLLDLRVVQRLGGDFFHAGRLFALGQRVIMPGLSGLALVRPLRRANLTLPVVMVSGTLAHLDTAKLTRDPGSRINGFVGKPFTIYQLLSAAHRAVDSAAFGTVSGHFRPE